MAKPVSAKWVCEGLFRKMIADTLGYTPTAPETYKLFLDALSDGDVQARLRRLKADGSLSDTGDLLDPSYWTAEAKGKLRHYPTCPDGIIEIDRPNGSKWLKQAEERRRPHRPGGTGFEKQDTPFVTEMASLRRSNHASSWTDAAKQVMKRHGKLVPGASHASPESTVSRLVKRAKKRFGGE